MRTLICLLGWVCFFQVAMAQNYYVASLQGEVFYNGALLQKRDRIQLGGTLRFGSPDASVKLSGPGGLHTLSANMGDRSSSNEFLLTVRQELFPAVRHIATVAQNWAVDFILDDPYAPDPVLEDTAAFVADLGAHIRRCRPHDLNEFLDEQQFGDYIAKKYQLNQTQMRQILTDKWGLQKRTTWNAPDYLWQDQYTYYSYKDMGLDVVEYPQGSDSGYRFLSGTTLLLPAAMRGADRHYAWLHQTEAGLTYRVAAMQGDTQLVIREDEFPAGVLHSAVVLVTDTTTLDTLRQTCANLTEARRLLCACYGVGSYLERNQMIMAEFEAPGVIPRQEFEDDMRFHLNACQAPNVEVFLRGYLFNGYIYDTYGRLYQPVAALVSLGLPEE